MADQPPEIKKEGSGVVPKAEPGLQAVIKETHGPPEPGYSTSKNSSRSVNLDEAFGDDSGKINSAKAGPNDIAAVGRQLPPPGKTTDLPASMSPSNRVQDAGRLTPPTGENTTPVNRSAEAPQSTVTGQLGSQNSFSSENRAGVSTEPTQPTTNPSRLEQASITGGPVAKPADMNAGASISTGEQQPTFNRNLGAQVPGENIRGTTSDVKALTAAPTMERNQPQVASATTQVIGPFERQISANGDVKFTKPAIAVEPASSDVARYPQVAIDNSAAAQPKPNSTTEANMARTSVSGEPVVAQNQIRSTSSERSEPTVNPLKTNLAVSSDSANSLSLANPAESATLSRQNSANTLENQNQSKLPGTPLEAQNRPAPSGSLDASGRPNSQGVSLDGQGRQNPPVGSLDVPGRQNFPAGSLDGQGRQNLPTGALDAQGKQNPTAATNDALGQTRRESGLQLPETKQSSGRTDAGGISNPDPTRQNTGRNDANTAKIPDAKTLAGLDQKFGDKLNPPASGRGDIPIVMPGASDILGGLRGIGQKADVKDGKEVKGEVRDGKDSKVDTKAPSGETKSDTKSGVTTADDKIAAQKGIRPDAENATKAIDVKPSPDRRPNSPDEKPGQDGRAAEGKQQGGSNLVHDGGTTSGNSQTGVKSEGAAGAKSEGGAKSKGAADRVGDGKTIGEGKTRVEPTGARVVDADGKLIGGRPEQPNTGRADIAGKSNIDGAGKSTVQPGSRSEGPFVLPPGSLPVPDLVGGIKNIGQQIDARTGKSQVDATNKGVGKQPEKGDAVKGDAGKVDSTKAPLDGVKTVVTGGARTGDAKPGDGKPVDSKLIDGIAAAISGAVRIGDVRTGADKPADAKTGDGVKTVVTGGANTGDAKTGLVGGVKAGDGAKNASAVGANIGDGVKTAVTGGVTTGDGKGADGKQIAGRNPLADKSDAAIVVPPSVVPLKEMIGNLKAIAGRIFPPESRGIKSDVFDNLLPGRKTEKLEGDRTQSPTGTGVRPEAAIPIIRSIDGQISKVDEQFVIKLPQEKGGIQAKPDKTSAVTGDTPATMGS